MKYQVKSSKLQNVQANTIRFTCKAEDLSSVSEDAISIALSDLLDSAEINLFAAANVLVANNVTQGTALTASLVSGPLDAIFLVLTDGTSLSAADVVDIVIKIK